MNICNLLQYYIYHVFSNILLHVTNLCVIEIVSLIFKNKYQNALKHLN